MQWTNAEGAGYGDDPYGGAGYTDGYEYSGSATTGTPTMSWDPGGLAQWTHSGDDTRSMWTDPHATGTYPYAVGPDPATTVWASPHGDILTVPLPEFDTSGHPVPEPDMAASEPVRPVFVDSSGRRQRRVLGAARLLVIPAGGYAALLISTMLGGPSISSPFVPQPDSTHPATHRATAPDSSPGTGHSAGSASPTAAQQNSRPTARATPGPTDRSAASTVPAATPGPTRTKPSTPTPTPTSTSRGRALGSSHKPVK
ncbi:hypothetical protein OG241_00290 [Streptomyces sp. NBC_01390]|uniref:hypothetical protein n=1 Tax=Streptomyces sp. NBC_01390 TaxID=2903850 RepID=UPI0032431B0F